MKDYGLIIARAKEKGLPIYYYEGKPYRVLHEGKVKTTSIFLKMARVLETKIPDEKELQETHELFQSKGIKWIDVVIYEPLYEECDIRICVKEKEDFYNNYKLRE